MSNIAASLVKELRDITQAGMMECKKALQEADGDLSKAVEILKKSGLAKALKRSKVSSEGLVLAAENNSGAAIIEVNCETDFVAKGHEFQAFVKDLLNISLQNKANDVAVLNTLQFAEGMTVEEKRLNLVAKLGENIVIRRVTYRAVDNNKLGVIGTYVHGGVLAKISTMVVLEGGNFELARDLAMHVAAANPRYLDRAAIPNDFLMSEREIFVAETRAQNSDKPENIIEKIIDGKLSKHVGAMTLMEQDFVKDSSMTVKKLLELNKAKIVEYIRFEVGEGIEKVVTNFRDEVMSQIS